MAKRKSSQGGADKEGRDGGKKIKGQRTIDEFEKQAAKLLDHVRQFQEWLCLVRMIETFMW